MVGRTKPVGGCHAGRHAGPPQSPADSRFHLTQLLFQQCMKSRVSGFQWFIAAIFQHRQRGFQRVPQVTQSVTGALQLLLGMTLQPIDFQHQRMQLQRHVFIKRIALPTNPRRNNHCCTTANASNTTNQAISTAVRVRLYAVITGV